MSSFLECVPNFSEGRDKNKVHEIARAASSLKRVKVIDINHDPDHHRSVVTFMGPSEEVVEAALLMAEVALKLIDLRSHVGVHPRIGAVDVVPFVPLRHGEMKTAVEAAREFGRQLAERFKIPVFLYGEAATAGKKRELPEIRKGGLEGLKKRMETGAIIPDFGPKTVHEKWGATVTGARMPLIAFNVNLECSDLHLAQSIASMVRERDGGLPGVRALGLYLASRGIVQVSTNITDYRLSSLLQVYRRIEEAASKAGVKIRESELIGLAPAEALSPEVAREIHLKNFSPKMIIEYHLP